MTAPPPTNDTQSASLSDGHAHPSAPDVAQEPARPNGGIEAAHKTQLPLRLALRQQHVPKSRTVDITERFTKACSALKTGQLVKDEYFTLFESISAIEIMDPKMDSGMLQPGETLEDDYDVMRPLLPEELIGIIDQLLCFEMAWHQGYPLSQTLFTSIYIDRLLASNPRTIDDAQFTQKDAPETETPFLDILRAYCLGVIKSCDLVIAKVQSTDYYEEEDFVTQTFNRSLFPNLPVEDFVEMLDYTMDKVDSLPSEVNDSIRMAIKDRLYFRRQLLLALYLDLPPSELAGSWEPVLDSVNGMAVSAQLGQSVQSAFSTKIQRRLASTVPPRPIVELSFRDAVAQLKNIINDCSYASRLAAIPKLPAEYESFLWAFAARTPAPLCYPRAYMARILMDEEMQTPPSIPFADFETLVFPPHSPITDPADWHPVAEGSTSSPLSKARIARCLDLFTEQAGGPLYEYWTALCQNKCRLRRMLTRVVRTWDKLQTQAQAADLEIESALGDSDHREPCNPLSLWVQCKKTFMLEQIVLLGFETNIHLPGEYALMYTFLARIISRRARIIQPIIDSYGPVLRNLEAAEDTQKLDDVKERLRHIETLLHLAKGTSALAKALGDFYVVLASLDLIPRITLYEKSDEFNENQYQLRMRPFLGLGAEDNDEDIVPPLPSFNGKITRCLLRIRDPDEDIWSEIEDQVRIARVEISKVKAAGAGAVWASGVKEEWEKGVDGLLKSCVLLGLGIATFKDALKKADIEEFGWQWLKRLGVRVEVPEVGSAWRYLEGWRVPRIVRVEEKDGK
ncbi:Mak10-domain-containing protein [Sporormia fimetaria CBS 119925]|uniref:Mak10-domain-containing protein n=1 Tax=Sporormia fimetaria CBS 119925 TaxID=1340428 RepID=A0A6A6V870_9PLEO|nr:Mak10-domain-containing protein [Sporormia fimetaria CBS 119925]